MKQRSKKYNDAVKQMKAQRASMWRFLRDSGMTRKQAMQSDLWRGHITCMLRAKQELRLLYRVI